MDIQLKRGILEVCVLKALQKQDSYGYRIIQDLSPAVALSQSTLYPILKRMEAGGCISEYSVEHNGRLRKYYHLTPLGHKRIADFLLEWQEVQRAYDFIRGDTHEQISV
ncbi:MAG: PadR family transcriptional regulator [Clostridiaceae bacterium]|nr:PadR family transcriptional regulator [Clostridia bacterium]MDY3871049.1 PadR family transcriptional regulator [Clostridiaceae bacterium]